MSPGIAALGGADLVRLTFSELPGFYTDDHAEAWKAFFRSCQAVHQNSPELRRGVQPSAGHRTICDQVVALGPGLTGSDARSFFEASFVPHLVVPLGAPADAPAFLTAYYRPEVDGSLTPTAQFREPLFERPDDLVTLGATHSSDPRLRGLAGARRRVDGALEPYPSRAEIDSGALGLRAKPIVYVADAIEAFMIHVQGSARIKLQDGRKLDLTYAGRNGRSYTSIGRILIDDGEIASDEMSLARLKAWVRENGQASGERGRALLHRNASFVFFSASIAEEQATGPVGAAGLPLTPHRSIAIDRSCWTYGLPFWIDASVPWQEHAETPLRRIMIAQDTGSAIIGPARADLYFGTGDVAGDLAGLVRHRGRLIVLLPSAEAQ